MTKERREKQLQMRCMGLCLGLLVVGFIPALIAPTEPVPEATEPETEIIRWKEEVDAEETVGVTVENMDKVVVTEPAEPELISLGEFLLTAYCSCHECCGKWSLDRPLDENGNEIVYGSSGEVLEAGKSIAVDTSVIPYGTRVVIEGYGEFIAQDTGDDWVVGNHIDIYFSEHSELDEFGEQYAEVFTYGK